VWEFYNIKFLISKGILRQDNNEFILDVVEKAKKEFQIEEELENIDKDWKMIKFDLKYDDHMKIHKICDVDKIMEMLENHGFQIQTI